MNCIEEIINIDKLISILEQLNYEKIQNVLEEIIEQSKVEFNFTE